MLLLLEVVTGLRSRSVPVRVRRCHIVSWVTVLLLPHLQSLILQLFLLELDLLYSQCQLIDCVLCRLRILSERGLMELLLCMGQSCARRSWGWLIGSLRRAVRMHLLSRIDGPIRAVFGSRLSGSVVDVVSPR